MGNLINRLSLESKTVSTMIAMYCRDHHSIETCSACKGLARYAQKRLESCRFGDKKPACAQCTVHCYEPEMREKIRQVMRYAGPRMLLRHPVLAIAHIINRRYKV